MNENEFFNQLVLNLKQFGIEYQKTIDYDSVLAVCQYFTNSVNFLKNSSIKNKPALNKGLLLIGNSGTLKTKILQTAAKIYNQNLQDSDKKRDSIYFVSCSKFMLQMNTVDKKEIFTNLNEICSKTHLILDDLKTEVLYNSFGKMNIFDDILQERGNNTNVYKTFATCNYNGKCTCKLSVCRCGFNPKLNNDLKAGLNEFKIKYSEQSYDRLFGMFNIIEFKGKSMRE